MVQLNGPQRLVLRVVVAFGNGDGLTAVVVALLPHELVD